MRVTMDANDRPDLNANERNDQDGTFGRLRKKIQSALSVSEEDAIKSSFDAVARWPELKVFTFGECAFRASELLETFEIQGARVVVNSDPVCAAIGQYAGYRHHEIIPELQLDVQQEIEQTFETLEGSHNHETETSGDTADLARKIFSGSFSLDDLRAIFASSEDEADDKGVDVDRVFDNSSRPEDAAGDIVGIDDAVGNLLDKLLPFTRFTKQFSSAREGHGDKETTNVTAESVGENDTTSNLFERSLSAWDFRKLFLGTQESNAEEDGAEDMGASEGADDAPQDDSSQNTVVAMSDLEKLFTYSWERHYITTYTNGLKKKLLQKEQGNAAELLQAYRMAMMTSTMSYVDGDPTNIASALNLLNSEDNPAVSGQPLYEHTLEHVLTLQFSTPARPLSRVLNRLGLDRTLFGFDAPPWDTLQTWRIGEEGIIHNVHLLKDARNNGYLTFQGTANLGTWLDIHFAAEKYDPDLQPVQFSTVDDARWEAIAPEYLRSCHTGLCNTLKAFVSNTQFSLLAKTISELDSLAIVGHSSGGSLSSMLAMIVNGVRNSLRAQST